MSLLKVNTIQHGSISSGGIELAADGSVKVDSIQTPTSGGYGRRNLLINGDFSVKQRIATYYDATSSTGYTYCADQWFAKIESTGTSVRLEKLSSGNLRVQGNSSQAAGATGPHRNIFGQALDHSQYEQVNDKSILQEPLVLSFGFEPTSGLTHGNTYSLGGAILKYNSSNQVTRSFPFKHTFTYNQAIQLVEAEVPITVQDILDDKTVVAFNLGCSDDLVSSSLNSWTTNEEYGETSADVKPTVGNTALMFSYVQLERGTKATPFEFTAQADALRHCKRYFQVLGTGDNTYFGTAQGFNDESDPFLAVPVMYSFTKLDTPMYTNVATTNLQWDYVAGTTSVQQPVEFMYELLGVFTTIKSATSNSTGDFVIPTTDPSNIGVMIEYRNVSTNPTNYRTYFCKMNTGNAQLVLHTPILS